MTRRRLLAAGAATLAGGCGAEDGEPPRADEQRGGASSLADVALLNDLLLARRSVAPALRGDERRLARLIRADDAASRQRLEDAVRRQGGEPRPGAGAPDAGQTATAVKELSIAAAIDALAKLSAPEARVAVAEVLAKDAEHLAELRAAAGADPVPDAFVDGRRPEEVGG